MAQLLGPDGLPLKRETLLAQQAAPSLVGTRSILSGHPSRGLTPARLASLLREAEEGNPTAYLELAEEMEEKDLHYRGVIAKRKTAVSQLPLSVVAVSDESSDQRAAALVREVISGFAIEDHLFDLLDGIGKGFAVCEILWDVSGTTWRVAGLKYRDPRWFRFDPLDGQTLHLLGDDGLPQVLPPYQFVIHTPKSKSGLPIRGGLARACAWSFLFKSFDLRAWVEFAEIYGHPVRLGKYGPGASEIDKAALFRALSNIRRDSCAAIPNSMMMEFIEAKQTGSIDLYERLADYLDRQISKAVLGGTAGTDAIAGGHAVGKEHRAVEGDIEQSDARQLAATLNRDLVRPLIGFNFPPGCPCPKIIIGRPEQEDLSKLLGLTFEAVDRGMSVGQSVVRDKLGFEDPGKDEALLRPKGTPKTPPVLAASQVVLATSETEPPPDDLEDFMAAELGHWEEVMDPLLETVRALLDDCDSLETFLERLPELAADLPLEALTQSLAKSLFVARALGASDAKR